MSQPTLVPDVRPWQPTAEAMTLFGKPIPPGRDFFVQPPPEIGPIVGAETQVKTGATLLSLPIKIAIGLGVAVVGLTTVAFLQSRQPAHAKLGMPQLIISLVSICVPIFVLAMAFKPKYLAYIGRDGAALFKTRGSRAAVTGQFVRFAEAVDLHIWQRTDRKRNLGWKMRFVDAGGQDLMVMKGEVPTIGGKVMKDVRYICAEQIAHAWATATGRQPTIA